MLVRVVIVLLLFTFKYLLLHTRSYTGSYNTQIFPGYFVGKKITPVAALNVISDAPWWSVALTHIIACGRAAPQPSAQVSSPVPMFAQALRFYAWENPS